MTICPGALSYRGGLAPAEMHSHHSVQVLFARRGEFVLSDPGGADVVCRAAVIPADVAHAVTQGAVEGEMVHLPPESDDSVALTRSVTSPESAAALFENGCLPTQVVDRLTQDRIRPGS